MCSSRRASPRSPRAGFSTYSPAQVRAAYGFNQSTLTGAGQTIAIVDAYNDPTIQSDLATFDKQFGLPAAQLTVSEQYNGTTPPAYNASWATEIALDVEWAHAIAPGAKILLVEANSASLQSLLAGVNYARSQPGVSVVSMSWGTADFNGEGTFDSYFTTPAGHTGVTFVASSGDSGAGASWPAISDNVLAVGGTQLTLNANGTYGSETAWSGSGGGYSLYETEGSYERSVQSTGKQSDPSVAYDASPTTGFYVYDSSSGHGTWLAVGGTSAGAPQWSGLLALVNQGRAQVGQAPLYNTLSAIYALPSTDFHDITTGSNGTAAKAGYDVVTGRGSPIANLIIPALIKAANLATTPVSAAGTTSITGTFKSHDTGTSETPPLSPVLGGSQVATHQVADNAASNTANNSPNNANTNSNSNTPPRNPTTQQVARQGQRTPENVDTDDESTVATTDDVSSLAGDNMNAGVAATADEETQAFFAWFGDDGASGADAAAAADQLVDSLVGDAGSVSGLE